MSVILDKISKKGFSMVELIIGLVIMAFILISTFSMMSGELGSISRTRDFSAAVMIAQETVETIRNFPFDKISQEDSGPESLEAYINGTTAAAEYPHEVQIGKIKFTRTVSIKNVGGAGGTLPLSLKAVELEIKWQSEDKKNLSYRLATCVTKTQ